MIFPQVQKTTLTPSSDPQNRFHSPESLTFWGSSCRWALPVCRRHLASTPSRRWASRDSSRRASLAGRRAWSIRAWRATVDSRGWNKRIDNFRTNMTHSSDRAPLTVAKKKLIQVHTCTTSKRVELQFATKPDQPGLSSPNSFKSCDGMKLIQWNPAPRQTI